MRKYAFWLEREAQPQRKPWSSAMAAWCVPVPARCFWRAGDSEDLFQEGMMGLLSAVRSFERGRDASFRTYAEICIRRRLYSAIRRPKAANTSL